MRILVTGSNGFLGRSLVEELVGRGITHWLASSLGENRNPRLAGRLAGRYHPLDVRSTEDLRRVLGDFRPGAVIHTAAMAGVDACEEDPQRCRSLNVAAVANLVEGCKDAGSFLVHISTDYVFDGLRPPYREDSPVCPLNVYGRCKLESEQVVQQSGLDWSILRTSLLYSTCGSGRDIVSRSVQALKSGQTLSMAEDCRRTPTYCGDLARSCLDVSLGRVQGVMHVAGPDTVSPYDLGRMLVGRFPQGSEGRLKAVTQQALGCAAQRPVDSSLDISRARRKLNFSPHRLDETLGGIQW